MLTDYSTNLGARSAIGIPNDLSHPDTKNSFTEQTAPFVREVSKDGKTFLQYFSDPSNAEMVTLANDGIVGWLNVFQHFQSRIHAMLTICTAIDPKSASNRLPLGRTGESDCR